MRCRPTDAVALVFLTGGIAAGAAGLHDRTTAVVLTLAWMSAAIIRLGEFRQGRRPAVRIDQLNLRHTAILLLGAAPWPLLPVLRRAYPEAGFWTPVEFGPVVIALGAVLGMGVVAAPAATRYACCKGAAPFASDAQLPGVVLRSAALLLITGSPVVAAMSVLWIAAAIWSTLSPVDESLSNALHVPPADNGLCFIAAGNRAT